MERQESSILNTCNVWGWVLTVTWPFPKQVQVCEGNYYCRKIKQLFWENLVSILDVFFWWKKKKKESHFQRWSLLFVQMERFHSHIQKLGAVLISIVTHPHELCFSLLNILSKLPGRPLCVSLLDHVSEDCYFMV